MAGADVRLGVIGLGQMGRPMVENLAKKGRAVTVFDLSAAAREAMATIAGVTAAASAQDVARACDTVILMLPDSKVVDALLWDEGFAAALARGALVIDMGSSNPMRTRDNASRLAAMGLQLVDAPVSGGVKRAVSATLAIMVGGTDEAVARAMPILADLGTTRVHVGASGGGHAVKALNNYVSAAGLVAACEALDAAERFGIDPKVANQVFNASTGRNNTTENKVEPFMLSGRFDSGFALALMRKDLQTALGLMHDVASSHALAERCVALWEAAEQSLDRGADHTAYYAHARRAPR